MKTRWIAACAVIAMLVAGCASGTAEDASDGTGGELQSTRWVLDSYLVDGSLTVVADDLFADAEFKANRVTGFAGCNDFDALYRTGGRMLLVGMPRMTLMACSETASAFESNFMALLQQSRFYSIRADHLVVRGPDRSILLVFVGAPNNPLLGAWEVDSFAAGGGAVTSPLEGTDLSVVFRLRTAGGSAGCNTFDGPYTTNGAVAAIGPLATTRMACAEDVMAQEASFLAALQGVGRIEQRANAVNLQDRDGNLLVALVKPSAEPEPSPSASPEASASPSASPSASASASPSATASPTASPTAAPTPAPTPVPSGSAAPTIAPPASLPPTATCQLTTDIQPGPTAILVYPADWFTVAAPPTIACRYFDPAAITVPADPATLTTAVMIKADPTTTYEDALAAATNETAWNVLVNEPVTTKGGLPATRLEATSTAGTPGYPDGTTRYGYLIDVGGFPLWIETSGTLDDATYAENVSVVDLIASQSTVNAPAPN
jgi:heat shock protein HslJ